MEEYAGSKEEATLELKNTENEQSVLEVRIETEQQAEEGRKKKRNEQYNKDMMDELVSNRAHEVMQKKIMKKDFIGERGFKQLIPPFNEAIEKRGWSLLCEHHSAWFASLVREFYSNFVGWKEKTCYIRGKWISFDRKKINKAFRFSEQKD